MSTPAPALRGAWDYEALAALVRDEPLPLVVVDLDAFEANVRRLVGIAAAHGKLLRPASKSVRVPELLRLIAQVGAPTVRGVMCYSVDEASLLASEGLDDLLVAYPTVQASDVAIARRLTQAGTTLALMLDSPEHAGALARAWQAHGDGPPLRVCIDVDMSWRPLGQHVGVQRSPVRTLSDFARVVDAILAEPALRLAGVMGYEAQIAGLGDENPFAPLLNPAKKLIKSQSTRDVAQRRGEIAEHLKSRGVTLDFFNGGGTGSIRTTTLEPWITEVTAGSGFLQSHLFDYYASNENAPAYCFALQVTRSSQPDHVTCQGGGFIASGPTDADKAPVPFLPPGLKPTKAEGFGEVQTPLAVPTEWRGRLHPGDPVFFRPAKAGELAERFNEYLLKRGDRIVGRAKTYRGLGRCFH
jgi:D-serine deaminase-like pyridoxal phosphate-dependent protein